MKYLLIALICIASLGTAHAVTIDPKLVDTVTLRWTEPTQNTDNTIIKVPPPVKYQLYVKTPSSTKFVKAGATVTGSLIIVTVKVIGLG